MSERMTQQEEERLTDLGSDLASRENLDQGMKMHAEMELSSELWSAGESERNSSQAEAFSSSRKRAAKRSVPEEQKDVGYWVRRQRNNAAARRSRETKRMQEQQYKTQLSAALKAVDVLCNVVFRMKERVIRAQPDLLKEMDFDRMMQEVPGVILRNNRRLQTFLAVNSTACGDSASPEVLASLSCDSRPGSPDSSAVPPSEPQVASLDPPVTQTDGIAADSPPAQNGVSSQAPIDLVSPPLSPRLRHHTILNERRTSAMKSTLQVEPEASSTNPAAFAAAQSTNPTALPVLPPKPPEASGLQVLQAADLIQLMARADPNLAQQMLRLGLGLGAVNPDPPEKRARLTQPVESVHEAQQPALKPLPDRNVFQNQLSLQDYQHQQQHLQLQHQALQEQQQQTLQEQKLFQLTTETLSLRGISPRHQMVLQQQQQEQQQQVNRTLRSTSPPFDKLANHPLILQQQLLQCPLTAQQDLSKFCAHDPPQQLVSNSPPLSDSWLQVEQSKLLSYVHTLVANFPETGSLAIQIIIPIFQEFMKDMTTVELKADWFEEIFKEVAACLRNEGMNFVPTLVPLLRMKLGQLHEKILRKTLPTEEEVVNSQQFDKLYKPMRYALSRQSEVLPRLVRERQSPEVLDASGKEPTSSSTNSAEDEFLRKSEELAKKRNLMFQKYEMLRKDPNMPLEKINEELNKLNANNADYSRLVEESKQNMMHERANTTRASSNVMDNQNLLHYKRSSGLYHRKYSFQSQQLAEK